MTENISVNSIDERKKIFDENFADIKSRIEAAAIKVVEPQRMFYYLRQQKPSMPKLSIMQFPMV